MDLLNAAHRALRRREAELAAKRKAKGERRKRAYEARRFSIGAAPDGKKPLKRKVIRRRMLERRRLLRKGIHLMEEDLKGEAKPRRKQKRADMEVEADTIALDQPSTKKVKT